MPDALPVHPFTGLMALGVLPSGRVVWPVLGGAPEDGDDDAGADDAGDGSGEDGGQDGDGLADKGREALAKERKARRDAEKARKAAEARAAEAEAKLVAGAEQDEAKKAADAARREAEQAAEKKANQRILRAELKAAAAGKLADPSDAAAFIDLSQFEPGADGEFDASEISEAISDLVKRKPHLAVKAGGFEGGDSGGGSASRRQLTRDALKHMTPAQINKAREEGRLDRLLNGG